MPALSDADKERCRYHLGYQNVVPGSPLYASLVFGRHDQYILEHAMNGVLVESVVRVDKILDVLDNIETRMAGEALDRLELTKADTFHTNPTELADLQSAYQTWQSKLANLLGVPVNPHQPGRSGGHPLNVRVAR